MYFMVSASYYSTFTQNLALYYQRKRKNYSTENALVTQTILFALAMCWRINLGCKIKTYSKINGEIRRHFGKQMNKETKLRIHKITAKAALKFGSEAWVLKKREEQCLEMWKKRMYCCSNFVAVSSLVLELLTLRRLMSYIYGAPILDVSRSHTTTQHSW